MNAYKRAPDGNCLEGIGGDAAGLNGGNPGVFVTAAGEMYVLVEPQNCSQGRVYMHPEIGEVELWNTHGTGELRWVEDPGAESMGPNHLEAVKYFGLSPKGMTADEWQETLDACVIKLEDLGEVDHEVLRKAADNPRFADKVVSEERVKGLDGKWHDTIRNPPEYAALYRLSGKGLIRLEISHSGCGFGQQSHIYRSTQHYTITGRGRKLLREGQA